MELKQFVKSVLKDIVDAVEETRQESTRDMYLDAGKDQRTVEFDIAVTVEDATSSSGKAGIKVFQVIEGGGDISKEYKNSSVSRIRFGIYIDRLTKDEDMRQNATIAKLNEQNKNKFNI